MPAIRDDVDGVVDALGPWLEAVPAELAAAVRVAVTGPDDPLAAAPGVPALVVDVRVREVPDPAADDPRP